MFRLRAALRIRLEEGPVVLRLLGIMLVGLFGAAVGAAAVESLFFSRFGPHFLPYLYIALGVATFLVMGAMSVVLARPDAPRLLVATPPVLAVALLAMRGLLSLGLRWFYPVLWVAMMIVWTTQVMASWGLAGAVHDTRQAKRLFPLYGVGLILGGIAGGLATGPLAGWLGTENLLLVWAGSLVGVYLLGRTVVRADGRRRRRRVPFLSEVGEAVRQVREAPLLRWLSLALMLFALLYFTLTLRLAEAATARFPRTVDLAAFLGVFMALSNAAALLVSLFVANRLFARFGVPAMVLALAVIYVVGFGTLVVVSGFAILVAFRFVQMVWVNGVWGTGWQALYNVIPSESRARIRSFMDAGPLQAGIVLSGVFLILAERALSERAISILGVAAAAATVWAMWRARRAYADALGGALRAGNPDVFGREDEPFVGTAWDAEATVAAVAGASDPDPGVRRVSVEVLATLDSPDALPPLRESLSDPDPEVRAAALRGLGRSGDGSYVLDVRRLLGDPEATVRAAAVETMSRLGEGHDLASLLRPLLSDGDARVAARAAVALLAVGDEEGGDLLLRMAASRSPERRRAAVAGLAEARTDPGRVVALLSDPDASVRRAAARAAALLDPRVTTQPLLEALGDPDPGVRERAAGSLARLRGADPGPLREYVARQMADAARYDELWRGLGTDGGAGVGLLATALREEASEHARNALRAVTGTADPEAMELAASNLDSRDPQQRANALEMLEAVGPPEVVRPIVALWESTPDPRADPASTIRHLLGDRDPWLRACAAFAASVEGLGVGDELEEMARSETDALARSAAETIRRREQMETLTTLSTMDRVLFMRKVPLFADLKSRDLGRIAELATEHVFGDGDVIAEQGEPGEEMHVVVSGEIRAIVEDEGGGRQEVGRRGPGDYVGEMAIITNQPRMASLVCVGEVRTLGLDHKRFERILTDRPEASLAVMRVLCDRLREAHGQGSASI